MKMKLNWVVIFLYVRIFPVEITLRASYSNYLFIFVVVGIALRASNINLVSEPFNSIRAIVNSSFWSLFSYFTRQPKKREKKTGGRKMYCNIAPFSRLFVWSSNQPIVTMTWCDKHHHALFVIIHNKPLPGTTNALYQVFSPCEDIKNIARFRTMRDFYARVNIQYQEMLWTLFASFKGDEFMKIAVSWIFISLVSSYVVAGCIFLAQTGLQTP